MVYVEKGGEGEMGIKASSSFFVFFTNLNQKIKIPINFLFQYFVESHH